GGSRHCQGYFEYPSPAEEPEQFLNWLSAFIKNMEIDWVFPTTEISSQLILAESDVLGSARVPFASLETVMLLADKWELVQLAQRIGIPHPISTHYRNAAELLGADRPAAQFPIVLKPC